MAPTQRKATALTAKHTAPARRPIMPLPLVLLSGLTTLPFLSWCLLWSIMIIMVDSKRTTFAILAHPFLFFGTFLTLAVTMAYTQFQISQNSYVFDKRDSLLIALTRVTGCALILFIFRQYFLDILTVEDIRTILPVEEIIKDINEGI